MARIKYGYRTLVDASKGAMDIVRFYGWLLVAPSWLKQQ